MLFKFENGDEVKDKITGFTGVIIARTEWLNGCIRYVVQSKKRTAEGKAIDDNIDEGQLVLTTKAKKEKKDKPGGPFPAPQRMASPRKY